MNFPILLIDVPLNQLKKKSKKEQEIGGALIIGCTLESDFNRAKVARIKVARLSSLTISCFLFSSEKR